MINSRSQSSAETHKLIFSILFGLGITFFLTNAYKYWSFISGPTGVNYSLNLLIMGGIQFYFLLNYFRYLFGLINFAEKTDNGFVPTIRDWKNRKKYFRNLLKLATINVGIVQLLLFTLLSYHIVPEIDYYKYFYKTSLPKALLDASLEDIYLWFFGIDLLLLISDVTSVRLYSKLKENTIRPENQVEQEEDESEAKVWITANKWEIGCCILALAAALFYKDFKIGVLFVGIKLILLIAELFKIYYLTEKPSNNSRVTPNNSNA